MSSSPLHDASRGPESGSSRIKARTEAILRAALEELASVGYTALSIEAVAARVGIAKTTVYRRYPTKASLVHSAVQNFLGADEEPPNTGTLRGDLIALGQLTVRVASSTVGKSLFRLGIEASDPELRELGDHADAAAALRNAKVARRAVERGEISSPAELERVMEILVGAIFFKLIFKRRPVDEAEVGSIVDSLLLGVSRPSAPRPRRRTSDR